MEENTVNEPLNETIRETKTPEELTAGGPEVAPSGDVTVSVAEPEAKNSIQVKLPVYEGPLDLLLDLIKKNEMNIYDIPMAEITAQYLEYLGQMRQLNLDIAGEFLVMAATLIYIKSKMLLPVEDGIEEDEQGGDPREELVRKLLEYQAFKEIAQELEFLEGERSKVFKRQLSDYIFQDLSEDSGGGAELEGFSNNLYDLLEAFYKVLKSVAKESFHEVFEQIITIEEKIAQIKDILAAKRQANFLELFRPGAKKNEIIVTFLAILEIVRQKIARVLQKGVFGEIMIESTGV
ncbi:MAG TPA: segregation/condensation protein A [Candidatus Omnitrophota bacterium]|nr:segregation/condensation protein A [Candidatus Omnitrophota bacterium]